jgi:hypothetical protein
MTKDDDEGQDWPAVDERMNSKRASDEEQQAAKTEEDQKNARACIARSSGIEKKLS